VTRPREGTAIPAPLLIPAAIGVAFLVLPGEAPAGRNAEGRILDEPEADV